MLTIHPKEPFNFLLDYTNWAVDKGPLLLFYLCREIAIFGLSPSDIVIYCAMLISKTTKYCGGVLVVLNYEILDTQWSVRLLGTDGE